MGDLFTVKQFCYNDNKTTKLLYVEISTHTLVCHPDIRSPGQGNI